MNRRETLLPADLLASVIRSLYEDAEGLNWESLPPGERTRQYARWVADPRVGGVLGDYMTPEQARSWIKDGPMKEHARARRGAGRYAEFGPHGGTGPEDVVRHGLGEHWAVVDGTVGDKPFHCEAARGDERVFVTWGRAVNFRHLVWAALRYAVDANGRALIVVTELSENPTPEDEAAWHKRVTAHCGLEVAHIRERLASTGGDSGSTS